MPGPNAARTPRRAMSGSVIVEVTNTTALKTAAASVASNAYAVFTGTGLSTTAPHPFSDFSVCPTEDGQQADGKIMVDWAGKGCYDSTARKVLWAGTGAAGAIADTPYNTMPLYDEGSNTWTAVRGWAPGGETTTDNGTGHTYDANCIDVTGRKHFKKKFSEKAFYVRDLDAGTFSKVTYTGGEASYSGDVGCEWIPSRSRIWIYANSGADDNHALWEVPATGGSATLLYGNDGGASLGLSSGAIYCKPISLNPRAFSDVGGVMLGNNTPRIIQLNGSLNITTASSGKPAAAGSMSVATGAHLCRDPVGTGWLYACTDGFMYRISEGGVWTQRAQLPFELRNEYTTNGAFDFVMVPIDAADGGYGVVWIVSKRSLGTNRAWLYKP
jgi:hypothetical protein